MVHAENLNLCTGSPLSPSQDVEAEVRTIRPWTMAGRVAHTYRAGRAFLVGDAAHAFPPSGERRPPIAPAAAASVCPAWLRSQISMWMPHLNQSWAARRICCQALAHMLPPLACVRALLMCATQADPGCLLSNARPNLPCL